MKDLWGNERSLDNTLRRTFIVPPFSIIDTTSNHWRRRKAEWLKITGNLSLTKEGTLFAKSIQVKNVKMSKMETSSNFDPVLAEILLIWFGKPNGSVLDPFAGEQTKGLVCGIKGYKYFGVEIRQDQIDVNELITNKYENVHYYLGDSIELKKVLPPKRKYDFCFTSPPYYNLEVYSKTDLSSLGTYEEFMKNYEKIFLQVFDLLKDNTFLALKISEIRNKQGGYYNFVGDNITIMKRLGFKYYNEIILINSIGTLPFRAKPMHLTRKVGRRHQNILVFYKGDLKNIGNEFAEL